MLDSISAQNSCSTAHLPLNVSNLLRQQLFLSSDVVFVLTELVDDPLKDALEAGVVDRDREHLFQVERTGDLNLLLRHCYALKNLIISNKICETYLARRSVPSDFSLLKIIFLTISWGFGAILGSILG